MEWKVQYLPPSCSGVEVFQYLIKCTFHHSCLCELQNSDFVPPLQKKKCWRKLFNSTRTPSMRLCFQPLRQFLAQKMYFSWGKPKTWSVSAHEQWTHPRESAESGTRMKIRLSALWSWVRRLWSVKTQQVSENVQKNIIVSLCFPKTSLCFVSSEMLLCFV